MALYLPNTSSSEDAVVTQMSAAAEHVAETTRHQSRRCSLTILAPALQDRPGAPRSKSACAVGWHSVSDDILVPFLDRPCEVRGLLHQPINSSLLQSLRACRSEWPKLQQLLFDSPRDELNDCAWLHQIRRLLAARDAKLFADLVACLGAEHLDSTRVDLVDPARLSTSATNTSSSSHLQHDIWAQAGHDGDERYERPTWHTRRVSFADEEPSGKLEVEVLQEIPQTWQLDSREVLPYEQAFLQSPKPFHKRSLSTGGSAHSLPDIDEEAATGASHKDRPRSISLVGTPNELNEVLQNGYQALRFTSSECEDGRATVQHDAEALHTPAPAQIKRHRRFSDLFKPLTPIHPEPQHSSLDQPTSSNQNSVTASASDRKIEARTGTLGVPPAARRRMSFARSFGELKPVVRSRRNSHASNFDSASAPPSHRLLALDADNEKHPRPLIERIAELEEQGVEKPAWLGILPDGRTRHPSAGAKAANPALAAFRASLGWPVTALSRPSSRGASSSGENSSRSASPAKLGQSVGPVATEHSGRKDVRASQDQELRSVAGAGPETESKTKAQGFQDRRGTVLHEAPHHRLSGLAHGGGLGSAISLKRSGALYSQRPRASTVYNDGTGAAAATAFESQSSKSPFPSIQPRSGGFESFMGELRQIRNASRRSRALSGGSVDSVPLSSGSQAVASEESDHDWLHRPGGLGSLTSLRNDLDGRPSGWIDVRNSHSDRSVRSESSDSDFQNGAGEMSSPSTSVANSPELAKLHCAPNFSHVNSPKSLPLADSSTHAAVTRALPARSDTHIKSAFASTKTPAKLLFPVGPSDSRPDKFRKMLESASARKVTGNMSSMSSLGSESVDRLVALVTTVARSELDDATLLARIGSEIFMMVDHSRDPKSESRKLEERVRAEDLLCDDDDANRFELFEKLLHAFGVEKGVVGEVRDRFAPATALSLSP
ncbi:hypothetical protein IE81DRAFT_366545 [Ceraceosorus guamensis]|uniref:Uncharacterized protein n=1 Tax=Ceraceosorus guamensis TaxID=1522189 RepID=A0A316W0G5_9BASI|nr:hypothetical protein IE81DRAFT_366545 [Ceraceosorus guamensis]PWN42618.1 hypothetical protein IE81DRAFT_366545 [Ceraceosorus guamensis]